MLVGVTAILLSGSACMEVAPSPVAHADPCPLPGCGGGGNSGADSSVPPGAMNGFQPPQAPQLPEYVAGQNYPAPNQNGWTSIYGEQGQQAAPAQQQPVQGQLVSQQNIYAANGEHNPIPYGPEQNAPISREFMAAQEVMQRGPFRDDPDIPNAWQFDDRVPKPEEDEPLTYSTDCDEWGDELKHERGVIDDWNNALNRAATPDAKGDVNLWLNIKAAQQAVRDRFGRFKNNVDIFTSLCLPSKPNLN